MTSLAPSFPWVIAWIALLLLAGVLLRKRFVRRRVKSGPLPKVWPLSARPLFRPDERRAYRRLREALPRHVILSKLPLVRFCQPNNPGDVDYWYGLLGAIQVSFCLCSTSGRVLAVIDLQNGRGEPRRTTQIKQAVLAACHIRYLRCSLAEMPSVAELQALVPPVGQNGSALQPKKPPSPPPRRAPGWQDSTDALDSFFGHDSRNDHESSSEFASLRGIDPRDLAEGGRPDDIVGIVVDPPEPADPPPPPIPR